MRESYSPIQPCRGCVDLRMIFVVLMLLLLVICQTCYGQVHQIKTRLSVCYITHCEQEVGTGTCVCLGESGGRTWFATAGHLFWTHKPGMANCKPIDQHVAIDEQWVPARIEGYDKRGAKWDLALVTTDLRPGLKCMPVAEQMPAIGVKVGIGGFPTGSPYQQTWGNLVRDEKSDMPWRVSTAVVPGVSGGPVTYKGEVIGIVSASDYINAGGHTLFTDANNLRAGLVVRAGRLPDCGRPQPRIPAQPDGQADGSGGARPDGSQDGSGGGGGSGSTPPTAPAPAAEPEPPKGGAAPQPYTRPPQAAPEPSEAKPAEPSAAGKALEVVAGKAAQTTFDWLWTTLLAPAIGIGGPVGAGIWLAGRALAGRLGPKVVTRVQEVIHERVRPEVVPVATDAPIPPQKVVRTTEFVPIEVDPNGPAYAWAKAQLVRRYPEALNAVEILESLIKQFRQTKEGSPMS